MTLLDTLQAHAAGAALALPVGVAYSGGADSSALLHASAILWPGQVVAVHVHHGLQVAADDFERHARQVCQALGVPLRVAHVQAGHAPGDSPEDAARQARYAALAQEGQALGLHGMLLAQHADDQVETLLIALSRGAGLPGLAAMPASFVRGGMSFHRPWLDQPGAALRAWLTDQGASHIDDPSNQNTAFTRNRVRLQLLPALETVFPQFRQTFARSARHAAQAQGLLEALAAIDLGPVGQPPAIRALQQLPVDRQANALRFWLKSAHQASPSALQLAELQRVLAACRTRGHQIHLKLADGWVLRQGEHLRFSRTPGERSL